MAHPETVTGESDPARVPSPLGLAGVPDDRRFSVSPIADALLAVDSTNLALPTATGATTPPEGQPDSQLPTINGYRVLGVVGRGGMGTVYKALHLELNKIVALKIVHPGGRDDSVLRLRFEREFRSLASIEHPNIVPVFDAGNWQGFPYFTMKFVPAGALSQHLDRYRANPTAGGRLVAKVARAVQHLHESGVLHRDLKPLNILIGEGDEPLVADFGLAKWVDDDSELSVTGMPMGTRQYMSPEQSLGKKSEYTPACDIWAIGIILYEVIAGKRPFGSDDPVELYTQIRSGDPPSMAAFNPVAPAALEAIARRCLAKRPEVRYASAEEISLDIERWLNGDATTATLPPVKNPPRRRVGIYACAIAILLIAVLGAFAYFNRGDAAPVDPTEPPDAPPIVTPTPVLKRTIAERVRAGETVELIGAKGMPLVDFTPLPGSKERFGLDDDFASLDSFTFGGVELVSEDLPWPVRFETEVAITARFKSAPFVGVYVGRQLWAAQNGPAYSQVEAKLQDSQSDLKDGMVDVHEDFRGGVYWWTKSRATISDLTKPMINDHKEKHTFPTPLRWHSVSLTLNSKDVRIRIDNVDLSPVKATLVKSAIALDLKPLAIPDQPVFGPGMGFCVREAKASFRNTKIVPFIPAP